MPSQRPERRPRAILLAITLALAAWATYLALGTYFGGGLRHDWRRSLVLLGAMALFLAGWWLLLVFRARQPTSHPPRPDTHAGGSRPADRVD
jgi:hypothetical protein